MPKQPPKTYDDIVRKTVPEMDGSFRPTREQEKQAFEGFRALDASEQALADRVHAALAAAGVDVSMLTIEIDHDRVILRGQVRDHEAMMRIPSIAGQVAGVTAVVDQLVIGT
jgi:osmotically-inducible protein OsmY